MTTQTAIADNYDFGILKTEQNSILIQLVNNTMSAGSTLSDFFLKPHSMPRILLTLPQITEGDCSSKNLEAAIQNLCDELIQHTEVTRPTTPLELLIGEIRSWRSFEANWDGEGAAAPIYRCIKDAESFIRLLPKNIALPEPMLHASGNTGLFWEEDEFYADIEFLDNGRIAYYIEQNGDKHKGAINFDSNDLPPVLSVLLGS